MKKIIAILMVFIGVNSFSKYDFPMKNPYVATIIGSSQIMTEGIPDKVPTKEYSVVLDENRYIPANMWYEKGFKYSLSKQEGKAPLIFILSGTGSKYDSVRTKNFKKIFYNAGYHVLTVTSAFNSNFIINVSNSKVPGILLQDGLDLYRVMEKMLEQAKEKDKIEVDGVYLTGYSMGATHSAVISYIDSKKKYFNFERVFLINPAVNLYYSSTALDNMLNKNIKSKKDIGKIVDKVVELIGKNISSMSLEIDTESIYAMFKHHELSNREMETLIGLAFNLTSVDVNYVVDLVNNLKVYTKVQPTKFQNMFPYFEKINFANFNNYLEKLAYPYYCKILGGNLKFQDMIRYGDLELFENYLKNEKKIAAVTNQDDFILSSSDREFIKGTFKERSLIYPYGGHCGNMFYQNNVDRMLKFLEKGEFNNEL
nr:serine/threonine protein kinase [uncultured Cetobacterium sp.]